MLVRWRGATPSRETPRRARSAMWWRATGVACSRARSGSFGRCRMRAGTTRSANWRGSPGSRGRRCTGSWLNYALSVPWSVRVITMSWRSRWCDIARRTEPVPGLRNQAVGVMQALRAQTGATVSLVIPTEQGCSALDVIPGQETLSTPIHAGIAMPESAAAALVFDPTPAPDRVNPAAGWASDDARVLPDLTCYASAIRVAGRIEAVLQISTTVSRPSDQFATLIRLGADRIGTQLSSP